MLYDLIIIGGGAAGTAAGVYAARRGLKFIILTDFFGGEVARSGEVENYPGFSKITGIQLAQNFRRQLEENKIEIKEGEKVETIVSTPRKIEVKATSGIYQARTVLIATGARPKKLGVPGEDELEHRGVTYCTTCDGPLFKNKEVAIVGGGNTALEAGLMMADIAQKITMVNLRDRFTGETILLENLKTKKNVEFLFSVQTQEILGEEAVSGIKIKKNTDEISILPVQGVMIHIGVEPNSTMTEVKKNDRDEIITDALGRTSNPRIFSAGDVTNHPYKQIAIAGGQGVSALLALVDFLNRSK